jgi:NADH dehydrogenase/NADH:ubiquinone oxidoreductase subunit G
MTTATRTLELTIDGRTTQVAEGSTILQACQAQGIDVPTFCWAENLTPLNVCRICVVELEGARTLVPACSRKCEAGMKVQTESERVKL